MSNGYANVLPRPSNPKVRPEHPKESTLIQNLIIASSIFCIIAMTFYNKTAEARQNSLREDMTFQPAQPAKLTLPPVVEADPPPPKMNWIILKDIAEARSPVRFEFDMLSPKVVYTLEFGDGQKTIVTDKSVTHVYPKEGSYKARLTGVLQNISQELQVKIVNVTYPIEVDNVVGAVEATKSE